MRYDLSSLDHEKQRDFLESVKKTNYIEDNYYKVFWDNFTKEYLLVKIDYVIKSKEML